MLHGSRCNQSGYIALRCMESTAFNLDPLGQAACNPLHSLRMHFTLLHGIQCIQSHCMESTAFNRYQLHQAAWNPLHSIEIHCTTLHRIHCIQSCLMDSTEFNRDPLGHTAWNPRIHSGSISQRCIDSTAWNLDAWNPRP